MNGCDQHHAAGREREDMQTNGCMQARVFNLTCEGESAKRYGDCLEISISVSPIGSNSSRISMVCVIALSVS